MAELAGFLMKGAKVDFSVAAYITGQLQLESIADFANYWTADEYKRGVQDDVVSKLEFLRSSPAGEREVARLQAAWQEARQTAREEVSRRPMGAGGNVYTTGFQYKLEAHELGGKNTDGGYGGPLCQDPYGNTVQEIVENLLAQSEIDKTLAYNNFTDPRPELTMEQTAMCKGFDYGDKTLKLPCGPLPWPAGCPRPGYVPKTNPLTGRWITVSGGQVAFIKEAIRSGALGASEAKKLLSDVDEKKTGGMYLRINQSGDVCTIDASVAKFARAKRTWKSGHYFYEPLVSGGNLLGVWVCSEECRKIGFFWEMGSGKCIRIERRTIPVGPYMFLRQATEFNGKVSCIFYVKVDSDPGMEPIPVQSRDFTALAGQDNVPDNLGNPYPCTARDLDYPQTRDIWLDANKEAMLNQRQEVATAFANVREKGFEVGGLVKVSERALGA